MYSICVWYLCVCMWRAWVTLSCLSHLCSSLIDGVLLCRPWLSSNSQKSSCLCLPSIGTKGTPLQQAIPFEAGFLTDWSSLVSCASQPEILQTPPALGWGVLSRTAVTWASELGSSCLLSRHSTPWGTAPALCICQHLLSFSSSFERMKVFAVLVYELLLRHAFGVTKNFTYLYFFN